MLKAGERVVMIFRPLASSPYDYKLDQHGEEWLLPTPFTVPDCSMLFKADLIYLAIVSFRFLQAELSLLLYFVHIVLFFFDNLETSAINITWSRVRHRTILTINLLTASQILLFFKSWTRRQFVY